MTTGLVLIAAILVLGGVIATMGDRIGMRVGKSRLSLFKLRPRQTATLITIFTGVLISASTFGILFAVNDQLRTGVFELGDIQEELATARQELQQTQTEKNDIEAELDNALKQREVAQKRLTQINQSLQRAIAQQERTEKQAVALRTDIKKLQTDRQQQIAERDQEIAELQQLQASRERQINQRNRELIERNQQIAERNRLIERRTQQIAEGEAQLNQLENQRLVLSQAVTDLLRQFQGLRQGNVALLRNQPLSSAVFRVTNPADAPQAIDQLLRQANRVAVQRLRPGTTDVDELVIRIAPEDVDRLVQEIRDGEEYVVRIASAGNYIVGEPCVLAGREPCIQVSVLAAPNKAIFQKGEVIAFTTIEPSMNDRQVAERFNLLITAAQIRIQQAGVLVDGFQISDGRESVIAFFEQFKQYNRSITVQAIAADTTYTAGPVRLELIATQNGQILFGTNLPPQGAVELPTLPRD